MFKKLSIFAFIYSISILLSRVIGLVREGVIGRILGTSQEADIYWMAFILPDFLNYLLAGGAVSLILIPLLHRVKEAVTQNDLKANSLDYADPSSSISNVESSQKRYHIYFTKILFSFSILVLLLTLVLYFYMPKLIDFVAPGYQQAQLDQLLSLSRLLLWVQPLHLISALFSAELQSRDLHKAPAIAPLLYTLGIIGGGIIFGPTMGAKGFVYGVFIGAFIGPFLLNLGTALWTGLRLDISWLWQRDKLAQREAFPRIQDFYLALLPIMLGFSIVIFDEIFMKKFATFFDTGLVSQLQYARALMKVPMGIFGIALGIAAFPTLSQLWQKRHEKQALDLLKQAMIMLLLLCFFSQLLLSLCAKELVVVIWGLSRFTWQDIESITAFTRLFAWTIFFWSAQALFSRIYYAKGQNWFPTVIGSGITIISYLLYALVQKPSVKALFGSNYLVYLSAFGITSYCLILYLCLVFTKNKDGTFIGKDLLSLSMLWIKLGLLSYVLLQCFDFCFDQLSLNLTAQWLSQYQQQSIFWWLLLSMALKSTMIIIITSLFLVVLPISELKASQQSLFTKLRKKLQKSP